MKKQDTKNAELEVGLREEVGKIALKKLRKEDFIPAVVYGRGKETQAIKIKKGLFLKFIHEFGRGNVIIDLKIMKDSKVHKIRPVLIKEMQRDPLRGDPVHIDFYEISLTEAITVKVPLVAIGEPVGVKQEGGMLEHHLWELNIECLPTQIPQKIEFDVANLKMGDVVYIKDLKVFSGIKIMHEPGVIIFSVVAPKKEPTPEEVAAAAAAAPEGPEVIKEKKKELEEEAPAEGKKEEKGQKKEEKKE